LETNAIQQTDLGVLYSHLSPMFIKTKERSGRTYFFLCIAERGGNNADSAKVMEHSVSLGETLKLSAARWAEILRGSSVFRGVPLEDILKVVESYVTKRGLSPETVAGLREAVHGTFRQKPGSRASHLKESETDEFAAALKLLGIPPGSSDRVIESAFRKSARRHHPDVGGDPVKFRALLAARDLLLGRDSASETYAGSRRDYDS
jgi:hypothetical protein